MLISSQLSQKSLESQEFSCIVHVSSRERDQDLTKAFHWPASLPPSIDLLATYSCLEIKDSAPFSCDALLIASEFDKTRGLYFIVALLALSIGAGVVVSAVVGSMSLAIETFAAIAGWIACIEGVILWTYK